jgi:hypothetical protein
MPANSQKMKLKAQNQLRHFPRKLLIYSCGELNDEKSIYCESTLFRRWQQNTFNLRMVSKRNVLVYIHLSVMLSVALIITQYFFDALLFTVSTLNLFFSKLLNFTTYSNWQNDWHDYFFYFEHHRLLAVSVKSFTYELSIIWNRVLSCFAESK